MISQTQHNRTRVLIIIPCYNEEDAIETVLEAINSIRINNTAVAVIDILAINDCSTDNTLNILKKLNCNYLDLSVNLGIGGAMHAGYKYAYEHDYDVAVQMDGDGQHPAQELYKILQPIFNNEADVVIGSRFLTKEGFQSSATRRMGIKYFRWLNQLLIGITIHDSTSGFRAFNYRAIEIANKYYPDEYPEPESIVQFGLSNLRIKEVPVTMQERKGGVSSINTSHALYYMLKVTLGILFIYIRLINKRTH